MVIDKSCRELNCDGGCGKVLGKRERRVSCAACDFDLCMVCAGGDKAKQVRESGHDEVFGFNKHALRGVCVDRRRADGRAGGAARHKTKRHTILGQYKGEGAGDDHAGGGQDHDGGERAHAQDRALLESSNDSRQRAYAPPTTTSASQK